MSENQKQNEAIMKKIYSNGSIDINRFKKFLELNNENNTSQVNDFQLSWGEVIKIYQQMEKTNYQLQNESRLKERALENMESEKFILNEQIKILENNLSSQMILRENLQNEIDELQEENTELTRDCNYKHSEILYQKKKKQTARRNLHKMEDTYKNLLKQSDQSEKTINNIEKRLRGLYKSNKTNAIKYFKDIFPDIQKKTCELCCQDCYENEIVICQNSKCTVNICNTCNNKVTQCPYCQIKKETINNIDDEYDTYIYESDGDDDYDYEEEVSNSSTDLMIYNMFNEDDEDEDDLPDLVCDDEDDDEVDVEDDTNDDIIMNYIINNMVQNPPIINTPQTTININNIPYNIPNNIQDNIPEDEPIIRYFHNVYNNDNNDNNNNNDNDNDNTII